MAINLIKGQRIDLKKSDGNRLNTFCVGANWGAIEKKGLLGTKKVAVDLDLSAAVIDETKNLVDVIYFGNLKGLGIYHSGDDLTGDLDGDDGLDNEVMEIKLSQIPNNISNIVFILNSYKKQDFATIPFASIRLYEGTPTKVDNVYAVYNIANDPKFAGYVSMILGKLYKKNNEWKFAAIGEPTKDRDLKSTLITVMNKYI